MGEAGAPIEFQAYAAQKEAVAPKPLELSQEIINRLDQETVAHGRGECCGFVVEIDGKVEVVPVTNILQAQGKADHAYSMDTDELIKLHQRLENGNGKVVALYHSHTNHATAHFSNTDAQYAVKNQNFYSDTPYIVIAAKEGKVTDRKAFTFNKQSQSFVESAVLPFKPLKKAA